MTVPYRPLARVRDAVNELGLEVTYAYEDLVYVEHNAFLLQMGERGDRVNLYFNQESEEGDRAAIAERLHTAGERRELHILRRGTYRMSQVPDEENILIEFFEGAP